MRLQQTIDIYSGGAGSGCDPAVAQEHGTTCGRPKGQETPGTPGTSVMPKGMALPSLHPGGSVSAAFLHQQLKSQLAITNNSLLPFVKDGKGDSPSAQRYVRQIDRVNRIMRSLDMEPGNWDVGLPGGEKGVRDVLVVGGGPAGLTTSINAASDGLNVLFVEAQSKAGGQSKFSSRIENFPGWPVGLTGSVLAKRTYKQALRMGAEGMMGVRVTGITSDPTTGLKTATLSDGKQIKARAVVIAAGLESKPLSGVPGLDAKNVVYLEQADELSKISKGKPVVILGGANSAAQAALGVTDRASHVYLISRSPIAKGMSDYQVQAVKNHPKITIIEGDEIAKLETDKNNTPIEVVTKGGRKIPAGALGIFIGSGPKTEWLPAEIKRNDKGSILTNADYETDMPGVFAIGDNRVGGGGRINIATAEGQIVERNLFKYFESMKKQYSKTPATAVAAAKDDKRRRAKLKAEWADLLEELLKLDKQYPNLGQEALEDY